MHVKLPFQEQFASRLRQEFCAYLYTGYGRLMLTRSFLSILLGTAFFIACANTSKSTTQPAKTSFAHQDWTPQEQQRIAAVQSYVNKAAREFNIEASLINGLIWVESRFDPKANGGGARGLMQLMPATSRDIAKKLGERSRPYDPEFNIRAGSYYLARMIRSFDGDVALGLAAYNAGSGTVRKWLKTRGGLPASSQKFVSKVLSAQKNFIHLR